MGMYGFLEIVDNRIYGEVQPANTHDSDSSES